ncbi:putative exosome subunit [Caldisphaera lagunensis DSM 15908]|uniref:Putative exosome subunit n=1 Tax=Caldisphaera lagunensis (strain DSM 15908 / JCM 11604 / ANMR 0165 / IC-154) TaxID=1056495 RepID=L0AAN7_CALLD|nr:RNA-binding domain-containing protein [Caldisphaera lagunensis]AFZ70172.1 putative exosome subunit [Caldisphaera lagunensis DSM 15908]
MIKSLEIRVFVHATEDKEKIVSSLKNIIKEDFNIIEEQYEGYYGNSILVISSIIEGSKAEEILNNLLDSLSRPDKDELIKTFYDRIEEKNNTFHLRLNKQKAYSGQLTLSDSDDVIKLIFKLENKFEIEKLKNLIIEKYNKVG